MKKIAIFFIFSIALLLLVACSNEEMNSKQNEKNKIEEKNEQKNESNETQTEGNLASDNNQDSVVTKCDINSNVKCIGNTTEDNPNALTEKPKKEIPVTSCSEKEEHLPTKCIDAIPSISSEKEEPSIPIPGRNILTLEKEQEIILASEDNNAFAEMKIKHLSRGEITISMNFFKPNSRATAILYGNWRDDNFFITDYLGKNEINIFNLSVSPDKKQIEVAERTENGDVKWTFTQVANEEEANAIHNGDKSLKSNQ